MAVLLAAALTHIVPGRPGYWLDLGLVMFALYLVGCAIGSWLRDWVVSRRVDRARRLKDLDATFDDIRGAGNSIGYRVSEPGAPNRPPEFASAVSAANLCTRP